MSTLRSISCFIYKRNALFILSRQTTCDLKTKYQTKKKLNRIAYGWEARKTKLTSCLFFFFFD